MCQQYDTLYFEQLLSAHKVMHPQESWGQLKEMGSKWLNWALAPHSGGPDRRSAGEYQPISPSEPGRLVGLYRKDVKVSAFLLTAANSQLRGGSSLSCCGYYGSMAARLVGKGGRALGNGWGLRFRYPQPFAGRAAY